MKSSTTARIIILSGLLATVTSVQANLITNGSFESGAFVNQGSDTMSLGVGSTVITGWTVVTDTTAWIGPTNTWGLTASDSGYFLDLTNYEPGGPYAGMSQSIATIAGATYSLSFDLGSSAQWGGYDSINVSAAGSSQAFSSLTKSNNVWTQETMQFVASSVNTTVLLQGASGYNYIGLDNVDVECVSNCSGGGVNVPEPGTFALLFLGLGGLAISRRRKQ